MKLYQARFASQHSRVARNGGQRKNVAQPTRLFFNREKGLAFAFIMLLSLVFFVSAANTASAVNNALSFDGTDDIVDIGDVNSLDGVSQYTAEAWVRFSVFTTNETAFAKRTSDTDRALVLQCSDTSGNVRIGVSNVGYGSTSSPLSLAWHHLAVVYNGGGASNSDRLKLYVDGGTPRSLTFSDTVPTTTPASSGSRLVIGAEYNLTTPVIGTTGVVVPFGGQIDEFRIWNVARSATEIQNNMYSQLTPASEPNLVAYYKFDEGSGTTLGDSKGSNHGTLKNFALTGTSSNWVASGVVIPISAPIDLNMNKPVESYSTDIELK